MIKINDATPVKCLLVDDLPENLLALEALLKDLNIEIYKASSGEEALELALIHDFALALIDVQMPIMNGFELAEYLRGSERTKHIPLIFVTAGVRDREGVFRGYEAGAVDFLYKPIDPHVLTSKVKVFIELHQNRSQIRRQEELFRTTFENAAVGLAHLDLEGRWIKVNDQYADILGYKESELIGQSDVILTQPEDYQKETDLRKKIIEGEIPDYSLEKQVFQKNGKLIWVKTQVALIRRADNSPDFFVVSLQDITIEKQAAESLQRAKEASENAAKVKSEFLANMSHEIRTPLTAIIGFTNLLLEEHYNPEDTKQFLNRIKANGDALLRLIEDILDLSKFESGKMPIDPTTTDLKDFIDEVTSSVESLVKSKGLKLKVQWLSEVPDSLLVDKLRVRQVLINLISNSVKFTSQGKIELTCSANKKENNIYSIRIEVKDSGVGIPPEKQQKIFNAFTQADASITRKFGGTGLGLTLSRKIAEALNGGLRLVRSAPNEGSVFEFTFEAQFHKSQKPAKSARKEARKALDDKQLNGLRILLAEDASDNVVLVEKYLKNFDLELESVPNGKLALEAAKKKKFDIILMDMQMPVMDGIQATSKLRNAGFEGPIIALTAHALSEHSQQALDAGCNAYITKPFKRDTLISTIRSQIQSLH